jgi:4-amino-4-deoxy-L-arabinose transferase-like glycosyltransferase
VGVDTAVLRVERAGATRRLALVILLSLAALFTWRASPTLTGPYGDSHDGRNAAVWAEGSRAIRHDGLIASRFGARATEGGVTETYANHPPLIYLETAVTETVAGQHPWAARLPAFLGSLALIALLYLLLRECGVDPLPSAAGIAAALAVSMFLVYGVMLDTPMTSLPFGVGLLLLWRRGANGRPVPKSSCLVAALTVLAGWQGVLLAVLLTVETMVRRRGRSLAVGTAIGLALLGGWFWWSLGSFDQLGVIAATRSGNRSGFHIGLGQLASVQVRYLVAMFPVIVLLLAVPAVMEAIKRPALAATTWVAAAVALLYTVGMRDGASFHDYWDYWWLLPLALGLAAVAARITDRRIVLAAAMAALTFAAIHHSNAERTIHRGWAVERLLQKTTYPAAQRTAWYSGMTDASWLRYEVRLPTIELRSPEQIAAAATEHPDDLVVVRTPAGYSIERLVNLRP